MAATYRDFVSEAFSRHWHRWSLGMWPSTISTCAPQPAQVGFPQSGQLTCLQMTKYVIGRWMYQQK